MATPVFFLMGPTASGKTNLAVYLTQHFPFDIISVDSALVYRGMDIGTAKPDAATLAIAPHHLLDIRDPNEAYSAAQFREDALRLIQTIIEKKRIPLLVGGTMLYFRALQQGLAEMPSADARIREVLVKEADEKGWGYLHKQLQIVDPEAAARIHENDPQRIQRALEVYRLSGKTISEWQKEQAATFPWPICNMIVSPNDRHVLHARIAERFKQMLQAGLIDEVKALRMRGDLSLTTPSIRSVGYRQVWEYLDGAYSYEDMQEKAMAATRQLAKRQLTWLRQWPDAVWFDSELLNVERVISQYVADQLAQSVNLSG